MPSADLAALPAREKDLIESVRLATIHELVGLVPQTIDCSRSALFRTLGRAPP